MTYIEVNDMMSAINEAIGDCSYAYRAFQQKVTTKNFFVFYFDESNDFYADGTNYQKIESLTIELYTPKKDFSICSTIEEMLNEYELAYDREEYYINDEKMLETVYTTEVVING